MVNHLPQSDGENLIHHSTFGLNVNEYNMYDKWHATYMYKTTCSSYLVRSYLLLVSAPIQYISSFPFGNLNFHTHVYTNATYSPHDFSKYLLPSLIQMRLYSLDIKQQQSINRDTATHSFACIFNLVISFIVYNIWRDSRGRSRMVVGITTTYVISSYHH